MSFMYGHSVRSLGLLAATLTINTVLSPTTNGFANEGLEIASILRQSKESVAETESIKEVLQPWWDSYVPITMRDQAHPTPVDMNSLISLSLTNSAQIQVYSETPLIRETSVREADAAFDWNQFAETMWRQNNDPVGNTLTIGGPGNRFLDDNFGAEAGLRRRTRNGSSFGVSQRIGWQDTNSNYFLPENQGTARLMLDFTMPLMRGRGEAYNTSLQVLTRLDVAIANEEFMRQLQSHLLEVSRGYWSLYLERASLAQKVKLYMATKRVYEEIHARQNIDASQTQLASAKAAFENCRSDLIRAQVATENAETRLRALINASYLGDSNQFELLPLDQPSLYFSQADLTAEVEGAIQNRPEIKASLKEIKAACTRLQVAENEMLPQLNLVTQTYLAGLRGNSDIGQAWVDQFSEGAPGYGVGLQFERPAGNRAASARRDRRRLEIRQMQEKYRATLENVKAEVEVAVRELHASQKEVERRFSSMTAAAAEATSLEERWRALPNGDGSSSLNLEALLRAFERVANAEYELASAMVTYNLSIVNLRRANGTLLQWEDISSVRTCENGLPKTELFKPESESILR